MIEQSTLLTLLLVRLNTDHPQTPVVGQMLMWTAFLQAHTPKYSRPYISVNDV